MLKRHVAKLWNMAVVVKQVRVDDLCILFPVTFLHCVVRGRGHADDARGFAPVRGAVISTTMSILILVVP